MSNRRTILSETIDAAATYSRNVLDEICTLPLDPAAYHRSESGTATRRLALGSIFSIIPSRRFYAPWTSHQTREDEMRDSIFWEYVSEELRTRQVELHIGIGRPDAVVAARTLEHFEIRELRTRFGMDFLGATGPTADGKTE